MQAGFGGFFLIGKFIGNNCRLRHDANGGKISHDVGVSNAFDTAGRGKFHGKCIVAAHGQAAFPHGQPFSVHRDDGTKAHQICRCIVQTAVCIDDFLILHGFRFIGNRNRPIGKTEYRQGDIEKIIIPRDGGAEAHCMDQFIRQFGIFPSHRDLNKLKARREDLHFFHREGSVPQETLVGHSRLIPAQPSVDFRREIFQRRFIPNSFKI